MCLSLEPYDVERLEQLYHFTSRSELVITWFTLPYLPLFSSFITQSLILPVTLFLSANIFVMVHSEEVPMLYLVYCKSKGNSREFVWQIIMVDGEWCSERW
jgi:DMSO/TMAO reductase YedYZ heme-binding membrane subunit